MSLVIADTSQREGQAEQLELLEGHDEQRNLWLLESLMEPRELTRQLVAVFGARAVGQLAGYQDPKIAYRWSRIAGPTPAKEALRRLYAALRIWSEVRGQRTHDQALAWFIAPHPLLEERQPLQLMTDGLFGAVSAVTALDPVSPFDRLRSSSPTQAASTALWHESSLRPMLDVVTALALRFGAPSVTAFAGERNLKAAYRWVKNEGNLPSGEGARRIYGVYRVVIALDAVVSAPVARAWFLAANKSLNESSPLDVARAGNTESLMAAADQLLFALNQVRNKR